MSQRFLRLGGLVAVPLHGSVLTGNGSLEVRRVTVHSLDCIGVRQYSLQVIAHTLPSLALVDGLLGLDFFENRELCLIFTTTQSLSVYIFS